MQRVCALFLSSVMTTHLVLAAAWLWLMPGGFALEHPRFWVNRVLPLTVMVIVVIYLIGRWRGPPQFVRDSAMALAAFWAAASVSGRIVFPVTAQLLWLVPLAGAAAMAFAAIRLAGAGDWRRVLPGIILAGAVGAAVPLTQHAGMPDTRPLNVSLPEIPGIPGEEHRGVIRITNSLRVQPNGGIVYARYGELHLDIEPLLTFISRSPDGCWTLLARRRLRVGPPRRIVDVRESADAVTIDYRDDGQSRLTVASPSDHVVEIEAISRLDAPVYSHLNAYGSIMVMGHRKLEIAFSPCPDERIEITPHDYPVGRPARFAYMSESGDFRVVEASSAEKGPFRTLASGQLARGEPLAITLFDDDKPAARIVLDDFSAQAGTAPSPTAGWGVPVNAIAFSLTGSSRTSPAFISVELAATGIGRGYDSVAHAPGTYRNRMRVESPSNEPAHGLLNRDHQSSDYSP